MLKLSKTLITTFLIAISISSCGAIGNSLIRSTPTTSLDCITFTNEIIEFHISNFPSAFLVLTQYSVPCSQSFQAIILKRDGTFMSWTEIPDYKHISLIKGVINELEENVILSELYKISHSLPEADIKGNTVFNITTNLDSGLNVLSCNENNCPKEVCSIYKLKDQIARSQEIHSSGEVICPVNNR